MKTTLRIALALLCAGFPLFLGAQTVQEFKTTPKSVIGYIEYIPVDYASNNYNYPVVIFLHGLGQRGPASNDPAVLETGYSDLVFYGPPKFVRLGTQFPFILISPQLKSSYGDWPSWYVMEVIEHVKTYLRIDPKRIYLTGTSLGGGGTWVSAQDYPAYYAAVAPVAGSTNSTSKACGIAASNLPVWAFHGDNDNVVPLSRSANMVNAINACGTTVPAKLKIYSGVGHNAYAYAYDPGYKYQTPNIYDWMLGFVNDHSNKIPVSNAGADQSITLPVSSVTLTGGGTDTDGTIVSYSWSKISGGAATLSNRTTNKLTASGLVAGTYVFRLTVKDDKGSVSSDDVSVFVKALVNALPVAKAGANKTVTLPTNSVTLIGSGTDSDGTIVSYAWSKVSGGAATLSGASTSTLSVTGMVAGTYTFRLTVKDDNGASRYDDVNVYVNIAPVANAGPDKTITLPVNSVVITGTGTDADGTISSYSWSKVSGSTATLSGTTTATLTAGSLVAGKYVFRLTVKDNRNVSKTDDVTVTVNSSSTTNALPVVSAGQDVTISLPVNSTALQASATDSDGTIASWNWIKVSGGAATLSGATTSRLSVSGLTAGAYVFRVTATDDRGGSKSDDVTLTVLAANAPPVANAGTDKTVTLPTNTVTITGSAADADGTITSYAWSKVSGAAVTLSGASTSVLSVSGLVAGSYVFRLTVLDNSGASHSDDVTVNVVNSSGSTVTSLTANAGSDLYLTLPVTSVEVRGSAATPSGTTVTSYLWEQVAGTPVTLSNVTNATLTVTGVTTQGSKTFKLTVRNSQGNMDIDHVKVYYTEPVMVAASGRFAETMDTAEEESLNDLSENTIFGIDARAISSCTDCQYVIYNETLQKVYHGEWSDDRYNEVFTRQGLYYYNIIRGGLVVARGKILKR